MHSHACAWVCPRQDTPAHPCPPEPMLYRSAWSHMGPPGNHCMGKGLCVSQVCMHVSQVCIHMAAHGPWGHTGIPSIGIMLVVPWPPGPMHSWYGMACMFSPGRKDKSMEERGANFPRMHGHARAQQPSTIQTLGQLWGREKIEEVFHGLKWSDKKDHVQNTCMHNGSPF